MVAQQQGGFHAPGSALASRVVPISGDRAPSRRANGGIVLMAKPKAKRKLGEFKERGVDSMSDNERASAGQENGKQMGKNGRRPPPVEHRFKPGHPGGPGRPKGPSLTNRVMRLLAKRKDLDGKPLPNGKRLVDLMAETILREALAGNYPFVKEVLERCEGKVTDRIQADIKTHVDLDTERARMLAVVDSLRGRADTIGLEGTGDNGAG
jgi:hypothetical protein